MKCQSCNDLFMLRYETSTQSEDAIKIFLKCATCKAVFVAKVPKESFEVRKKSPYLKEEKAQLAIWEKVD